MAINDRVIVYRFGSTSSFGSRAESQNLQASSCPMYNANNQIGDKEAIEQGLYNHGSKYYQDDNRFFTLFKSGAIEYMQLLYRNKLYTL